MKNKKLLFLASATVLFLGVSVFGHLNHKIAPLEAAAHQENYDPYYYSGTYYDKLDTTGDDGLQGDFRKALSSLIFPDGWYIYGSSGDDHLSTQLQYADEDPNNNENMIYFYTRDSVKKNAASTWNREHVWPQSNSNGNWDDSTGKEKAGTDILHIRPTYDSTNNSRGNLIYGDLNKNDSYKVIYSNVVYGYKGNNRFEPIDCIKGDVARIIMYVWTAYYDHYKDSNLLITKTIESYDTLLRWHTMDQPDESEGNRNNYAETSRQKNRNPFVDHPEYAWRIFGDSSSESVKNACMEQYPANGYTGDTKTLTGISISGTATKTQYYVGESFDPTGLTVTATYDDGSTKGIPASSCNWTPNPLTVGTTSVTCTYRQETATYSGITVSARETSNNVFSVDFIAAGADGSSELSTSSIFSNQLENNTLIKSVDSATKVFPGTSGLKLGASKNNGSITFTLLEEAQNEIESIEVVSTQYGTDNEILTITLGNNIFNDVIPGEEFFETFDMPIAATTLTIATNAKRAYLNKIVITIKKAATPIDPDDSNDSSSSGQLSSEDSSSSSKKKRRTTSSSETGCNGSVIGTTSLLGISALIGLVFVFSKKK